MYLVHTVRNHLLFNIIEMSAHEDSLQLHTELVGEFATFGAKFQTYISNLVAFKFTIYKYVIHDYPMVLLSMSSTIRLSTSASDEVRVLFSLALKTMFFPAFTLVGEPTLPICAGSASMSAAPQVVNSRFLLAHTRFTLRTRHGAAAPLTVTTIGSGPSTVSTPPSMWRLATIFLAALSREMISSV